MIVLLTGKSGSGKSTVAGYLRSRGYQWLNLDEIYRNLMDCPPTWAYLAGKGNFPGITPTSYDKNVFKTWLFQSRENLDTFNTAWLPYMERSVRSVIAKAKEENPNVVVDGSVTHKITAEGIDYKLVVTAVADVALARLLQREPWSSEELLRNRIASQWNPESSEWTVVENNGTLEDLIAKIETILYHVN